MRIWKLEKGIDKEKNGSIGKLIGKKIRSISKNEIVWERMYGVERIIEEEEIKDDLEIGKGIDKVGDEIGNDGNEFKVI